MEIIKALERYVAGMKANGYSEGEILENLALLSNNAVKTASEYAFVTITPGDSELNFVRLVKGIRELRGTDLKTSKQIADTICDSRTPYYFEVSRAFSFSDSFLIGAGLVALAGAKITVV